MVVAGVKERLVASRRTVYALNVKEDGTTVVQVMMVLKVRPRKNVVGQDLVFPICPAQSRASG